MTSPAAISRAMRSASARQETTSIGWFLWAVASAFPWLLPTHAAPWTTVYSEMLMALVLLPAGVWALWSSRGSWRMDSLAACFALAAVVPVLQACGGMFSIPAEAPLISQYLTAFALTLLVARRAEEIAPLRLVDGLFTGFAIAALISTGIELYQWLQLDGMGVLLAPMPSGDRPVANVGQPNNLSTLLLWGLVAIWWAHARRRIGSAGAILAAAFLLIGVALTQSRTGFLGVAMLGSAAVVFRKTLRTSGQVPVWAALALWFIACVVGMHPLGQALLAEPGRSLIDSASPRERLTILRMDFHAIAQHPWLGYGWNQVVTAQVASAGDLPRLHGTVGNAHNLVLDLMLWNGVPIAVAITVGLCLWYWRAMRGERKAEHILLLVALSILGLHSMLELPHVLAYFLLPAAVMMGTLNARQQVPTVFRINRYVVGVLVLIHAGALVMMFDEYRQIEESALNARMRAARIANVAPANEPNVFLLRSLQDGLLTLRTEPQRGMAVDTLEHMRRVVTRYPVPSGLLRYAQASALNGQPDDARWALGILCSLHPVTTCEAAAGDWATVTAENNPEMAAIAVPLDEAPPPLR